MIRVRLAELAPTLPTYQSAAALLETGFWNSTGDVWKIKVS